MSARFFDRKVTSIAFCWRIDRRDGGGVAMTSHDRSLTIDGTIYEPAPGVSPAAITAELGLAGKTSEIAGSLTHASISEDDLLLGRWDGASLRLFAVDWAAPQSDRLLLMAGELGHVSRKDGAFTVDLLGNGAKLDRPICPMTSPECRAELGDGRCRVDMAGRRTRAKVVSTDGASLLVDRSIGDEFLYGPLRILGSPCCGWRTVVVGIEGERLLLRQESGLQLVAGTVVEVAEGCDKRLSTCAERFANAANFRGEPHLPGNDLLTRYPGA